MEHVKLFLESQRSQEAPKVVVLAIFRCRPVIEGARLSKAEDGLFSRLDRKCSQSVQPGSEVQSFYLLGSTRVRARVSRVRNNNECTKLIHLLILKYTPSLLRCYTKYLTFGRQIYSFGHSTASSRPTLYINTQRNRAIASCCRPCSLLDSIVNKVEAIYYSWGGGAQGVCLPIRADPPKRSE